MTGTFEPVVAIRTEQDEVDQQSQGEQKREQRDQCSPGIKDHPDFMHIKSPGLLDADLEGPNLQTPHNEALIQPYCSQGRHIQARIWATKATAVKPRKLLMKIEWNSLASPSVSPVRLLSSLIGITSLVKDQFGRTVPARTLPVLSSPRTTDW
jgi:hypothetical protein